MAIIMWRICVAILASALIFTVCVEGNTQTTDELTPVEGSRTQCGNQDCQAVFYDTDSEECCGDTVYLRDFSETGQQRSKCCTLAPNERGKEGVMYSTETHDCCNFRTIVDRSTHACCNSVSYELATHGCCGGRVYDKEEQICCNGNVLHSRSEGDSCCGNIPYNSVLSTCCGGTVTEGIGKCCGTDVYLPNKDQLCCNMVVHSKTSPSVKCCGSSTYDENTEICCQGDVSSRELSHHGIPIVATACCGSEPFNEDNQACCNHEVLSFEGQASCCDGDPYNKEYKTCVIQYGFYDFLAEVADIPQITRRFFHFDNDNSTAYLSSEQFECGGRLHKYAPGSTSCCAGSIVFDSSRYLCCSFNMGAVTVEKTSPNAICCGEGSYNPDTEGCCNGVETFDLETQQCCPNDIVRGVDENCDYVPECSVQRGNDKTCMVNDYNNLGTRFIHYNSEKAVCTSTGVKALPPGLAACGDNIYRTSKEICCHNNITARFLNGMERECCDTFGLKNYYTPEIETCYNWEIHPIPRNVSEICSGYVYDSRYDGCDIAGNIRRKEEILKKPDACYNMETGLFYFNKLHHSCCRGHLIAVGHACCDVSNKCCQPNQIEGHNTETHICCDGNLVEKHEGHECCGTQTYDSTDSSKLCCLDKVYDNNNGNVWCEGDTVTGQLAENQIICRGVIYTGNNIECCGAEKYDLDTEICCRDFKHPKTSESLECCGSAAYDTSDDALCCGGSLYLDAVENDQCCGNVTYDTASSTCCTTGGSKYVMSPGQCCSNGEEFDNTLHTCCDGLVHKSIANGECCGNHVIREPSREFCCGGRFIHHYGDKKCCDGRVISFYEECSSEN